MSTSRQSARSKRLSKSNRKASERPQGDIEKYLVARNNSGKRKQSWLTPPEQTDEDSCRMGKAKQMCTVKNSCFDATVSSEKKTTVLQTSSESSNEIISSVRSSYCSFRNIFVCRTICCPLPNLKWANSKDVWSVLKAKDKKYVRERDYMKKHPQLQSRMRSVLLDWMIEVCEVYRLHRETFHLAADFIDRYLSAKTNVPRSHLQLIGVTALFIAAKLEEIYPPKITEFAYITDGACNETDITRQEIIMLKTLNWDLTPLTINMWITIYLNVLNNPANKEETCLTKINFSRHSFIQIARLMDLVLLDEGNIAYPYGVLAASILYHFGDETSTYQASGFLYNEIEECVSYLAPFAITIREANIPVYLRQFENVLPDDIQNIQTHDVTLDVFDLAKKRQVAMLSDSRASPELQADVPDVLTPPPTKHKHSVSTDQNCSPDLNMQPSIDTLYIAG